MTVTSRKSTGTTLIEIMVAGALFGTFTGMVASAMVMAQKAQDTSTAKLDAVRRASVALDLLVRDVEGGRYASNISMNNAPVPTSPTSPEGLDELQIRRWRQSPGSAQQTATDRVTAGYWLDPGNGQVGNAMIRRTIYDGDSSPLAPFPGEDGDGRVLVRHVKRFLLSREVSGGLTFIKADIWVGSLGSPISAAVATERSIP